MANELTTASQSNVAQIGQADARRIAVLALTAEDAVLDYRRAYDDAAALYREARNPPYGCADETAWAIERIPPVPALEALQRDIKAAGTAKPDVKQNRVFVALLADSFPASRGATGVATEALLHDLRDGRFSPAAVAQGLRDIRKTAKFAPAISEVLEAVAKAQEHLNSGPNYIGHMIRERETLDRRQKARLQRETDEAGISSPS